MASLLLLGRALLLAASFTGLCALLRVRCKLDACVAPFTASCGIIVILMLAGFMNVMFPAVCALYALGFAGLIYAYLIRRSAPSLPLLLAFILFCAFLVWRFYFCPLYRNDDLSHWGLVARHLLRHDRLPAAGDDFVYFQSYPLGTACFIYYIGRMITNTEGIYLVAQNLLLAALFLPVFSLIRQERRIFIPIAAALFFLLFYFFRYSVTLQVDLVLSFFGIGIAAAIVRYRDDFQRAMLSVLPAILGVAYIKNSGLFFAAVSAAILFRAAKRCGVRRAGLLSAATFAASVLAYALWELHISLHFPAALETKHAVSLTSYMQQFFSKDASVIRRVAWAQLRELIRPTSERVFCLAVMVPCALVLLAAARRLPADQRRRAHGDLFKIIAVYFIWFAFIFLMYIFSMPEEEALCVAGFFRYNSTGLAYMMGLTAILVFDVLQRTDALRSLLRWGSRLGLLFIVITIAVTAWPTRFTRDIQKFYRDTQLSPLRQTLADAREALDLRDGSRFLVYWLEDYAKEEFNHRAFYTIKYEFETNDIVLISNSVHDPAAYSVNGDRVWLDLEDVTGRVEAEIDRADAFLILGDSADFEEKIQPFLATYAGDTPIYRPSVPCVSMR